MRREVIVASLAVAACGLFPDVSNLTGDAAPSTDAAQDAPLADTSVDAPPMDATSDAGDAGDAGNAGFCATHLGHTFCEDFDEPNYLTRWTGSNVSTGSLGESDASAVSPPNELLASTTIAANGSEQAFAYKHFNTASKIKVQVQLMVDPTSALTQLDPLVISFNPPPTGYTNYDIHIDTADGHLGCTYTPSGMSGNTLDTNFTNALTSWHDLELDIDMTTAAVQIFVDGVATVQWTAQTPVSPSAFDLQLGIVESTNPSATAFAAAVHADNVLVDIQ